MSFLASAAAASSVIQVGGSALSLIPGAAALIFDDETKPGIAGFVFDIPISEQLQLNSQITDHWLEDNSAIQDHIALEPVRITLTGEVGELIHSKTALETYAQEVLDRLGPLGVLTPEQSLSAQRHLSEVSRLKSAATTALNQLDSLAGMFSDSFGKNYQQEAYLTLSEFRDKRGILTVETPWKTFKNMVIESLTFEQDESTKDVTTITATFKQIRLVETQTIAGELLGRIKEQKSDVADKGVSKGKSVAASAFDAVSGD